MSDLLKSGPCTLEKLCTRKILDNILLSCGRKIEDRAKVIVGGELVENGKRKRRSSTTILTLDSEEEDNSADFQYFQEQCGKCRAYLSSHLSSCTLDNLVSEVQQLSHRSGFFFALSSLCSDRLSHLPISSIRKVFFIHPKKVCWIFRNGKVFLWEMIIKNSTSLFLSSKVFMKFSLFRKKCYILT